MLLVQCKRSWWCVVILIVSSSGTFCVRPSCYLFSWGTSCFFSTRLRKTTIDAVETMTTGGGVPVLIWSSSLHCLLSVATAGARPAQPCFCCFCLAVAAGAVFLFLPYRVQPAAALVQRGVMREHTRTWWSAAEISTACGGRPSRASCLTTFNGSTTFNGGRRPPGTKRSSDRSVYASLHHVYIASKTCTTYGSLEARRCPADVMDPKGLAIKLAVMINYHNVIH